MLHNTACLGLTTRQSKTVLNELYERKGISYWRTTSQKYPDAVAKSTLKRLAKDAALRLYCDEILETGQLCANEGVWGSSGHPPVYPLSNSCPTNSGELFLFHCI